MNHSINDKPFVCNENGCQESFTNVDHLTVHQKKHEMRLKFSTNSREVFPISDQTPTPSRILGAFLQNWEDVGLPHEIQEIRNLSPIGTDIKTSRVTCNSKSSTSSDNPFAQSFMKALIGNNKNSLKTPELFSRNNDSPLNTPSIIPSPSVCNEGLMAIVNAALNTPDNDYRSPVSPLSHNVDKSMNNNNKSKITDDSVSSQSSNCSSSASNLLNDLSNNSGKCGDRKTPITHVNFMKPQKFQAVSVICSANTNFINTTVAQTIPNIVISQPNKIISTNTKLRTVPIAQNSKTTAIIAPKSKDNSVAIGSTNSLYKVILKLPDGRSVQLPLLQQPINANSIVSSQTPSISAINSSKVNLNNNLDNETIRITNKISIGQTTSDSSQLTQPSGASFSSLQSKVDATLASLPPKAKPGRKSKFAPEEDPKEKKARSLERNRAAAMRCRLKRKHWIDSLEEKADEYEKVNERLQNEVVSLRREVTLLKTALLAHKDCPVTLQQKSTNDISTDTIPTTNGNHNNQLETNGMT